MMPLALILAGGLGTRLRPVLADLPKVLAPVHGRPFITYQLGFLTGNGISDVVLCLGYKASLVQSVLGDGRAWGAQVRYSVEPQPLGTGGALRHAQPRIGPEPFLVLNGDTYHQFDPLSLLGAHQSQAQQGALITLLACQASDVSSRGALQIGDGRRVLGFYEKDVTGPGWVNAGAYAMEPDVLSLIPAREFVSLERDILPILAEQGRLYAWPADGGFMDIGTPDGLRAFEKYTEVHRL